LTELSREFANSFNDNEVAKRKQDTEEVREINVRIQRKREKAFAYYEKHCEATGKFVNRACLPLKECFKRHDIVLEDQWTPDSPQKRGVWFVRDRENRRQRPRVVEEIEGHDAINFLGNEEDDFFSKRFFKSAAQSNYL
jgi:hypothetical protein